MGTHEEQILQQLNPQSAASLVNLATNVRGLLVLGLGRLDGASQWDMSAQQERRSVLAVIGALEHGAEAIRKRFAKDMAPQSAPAVPRVQLSPEEAATARARCLDLDLVEKAKPLPIVTVKRLPPCPSGTHVIPGNAWTDRCQVCGWTRDTCMRRGAQIKRGSLEPSAKARPQLAQPR